MKKLTLEEKIEIESKRLYKAIKKNYNHGRCCLVVRDKDGRKMKFFKIEEGVLGIYLISPIFTDDLQDFDFIDKNGNSHGPIKQFLRYKEIGFVSYNSNLFMGELCDYIRKLNDKIKH